MKTRVEFQSSYDQSALADEWIELELRSTGSFFLSWAWIGCWLKTSDARPVLVRVADDSRTVALGFLSPHDARRHLLSARQLCLNETGDPKCDRITIEHNGFLTAVDAPHNLIDQIFVALQSRSAPARWDEIVLSGVSQTQVDAAKRAGLRIEVDRASPDFCVDLAKVRASKRPWLKGVSSNLRSQIRQSHAFAELIGPISLTAARTASEALEYFDEMASLHNAYWMAKGKAGAFTEDFVVSFHKRLLSAQVEKGNVEMLRLSAGDRALGYLYNFLYSDTVSNYQSGFSYLDDNRHRPGLLAHAFAIERALSGGWQRYDFLAGDAHYKQRMGENMGSLIWCRAQRNRAGLIAEAFARRAKRSLTQFMR